MTDLLKIKLDAPPRYNGTTEFETFAKKLTNYMSITNSFYGELMKDAASRATPITQGVVRTITDPNDASSQPGDAWKFATTLYYVLSNLTEGAAFVVIDQIDDNNGLEAWRLLHVRFARTKTQTIITTLVNVINTKFDTDKDFESTFAKWESELQKFERGLGRPLYDEIKVGLLIAGTSGKLHDHLCFTTSQTTDYGQIREIVLNYVKTKQLAIHTRHTRRGDPMEVDAIKGKNYKGGKGGRPPATFFSPPGYKGKKGKAYGKGGKSTFKGKKGGGKSTSGKSSSSSGTGKFCSNCRTTTHNTIDCWNKGGKGKRVQATYDDDYEHDDTYYDDGGYADETGYDDYQEWSETYDGWSQQEWTQPLPHNQHQQQACQPFYTIRPTPRLQLEKHHYLHT